VFVSPDGFFAAVPFAALVLETAAGPRPLIERTDVVTVPCAGVLAWARSRGGGTGEPGVVAMTGGDVRGLPGARGEAGDIARRFRRVEVVTGFEGDAAAFASTASHAGILHIAAHARVNDESPWDSGFWLGPAAPGEMRETPARAGETSSLLSREDSLEVAQAFSSPPTLHAWEIAGVSLPNELAVLAGCETAAGRMTTGEAVLGLTAAFLSAGVPVVVSAAWPIDDRATAEFMRSFYGHLSAAAPVAEALRLAQLDLKSRREFSHPFYWAGFAVAGDGSRVVPVEKAARAPAWILLAAAAAAAAAGLWYRARRRTRSRPSQIICDDR
jgi:CHAT domain-containing protein